MFKDLQKKVKKEVKELTENHEKQVKGLEKNLKETEKEFFKLQSVFAFFQLKIQ